MVVLSIKLTEWLRNNLESWQPTSADVVNASRHFKEREKKRLFYGSHWDLRNALGKLYEYMIYEKILALAQDTDLIKYIARKGRDAAQRGAPKPRLASNGMIYNKRGEIYVRGNGQDLAEFDVLLVDSQDRILSIEAHATKVNLKDFVNECHYKRNLLEFLFGSRASNPIVVSFIDPQTTASFREVILQTGNPFVLTRPIEGPLLAMKLTSMEKKSNGQQDYRKLIMLNELRPREFNYRLLHDQEKNQLIGAAFQPMQSVENLVQKTRTSIVKNVIVGILNESAVTHLLGTRQMVLTLLEAPLSNAQFHHYFSRVLLVLSLPELRPTLYLRVRNRRNYLKLGPVALSTFKFERNIEAKYTEFFGWLDETNTYIGKPFMQKILDYYLREQIIGQHRKKPQSPKL